MKEIVKTAAALAVLGTLAGCSRPTPGETRPQKWPVDDYARRPYTVPDQPLTQAVFGIAASEKVPLKRLEKEPALVGVEIVTMENARGEIHIRFTVIQPRRPFILRLERDRDKPLLNMGREGVVYAFTAPPVIVRNWGPVRIPKKAKVTDVRLYLANRMDRPIVFKGSPDHRKKVRWPKIGGISRFPLYFALAFTLDNDQTLVRTGSINKKGRQIDVRYYRVKTAAVTGENLTEMLQAAASGRDPKNVAVIR